MENGQQEVQPSIPLGRTWGKLPEDMSQRDRLQRPYGNPQRLESRKTIKTPEVRANRIRENQATIQAIEEQLTQIGNTQIPKQQISGQESPLFTIPGSFQEKKRIQGKKEDLFQPKEERVRPNEPEAFGFGEESTQEPEIVVHTSRISSPINRNMTPTQIEHNVVTPESNLHSDSLWLQMSQFFEKTQKQFLELQASHVRMKKLTASMDKIVKTLQEGHSQFSKASEETNKRLKKVFEEQHHRKRDRDCLDKDINKLLNISHNMKPQPQGHAKKKVYAIEKVPEEESHTEGSESEFMGDSIREKSDKDQDPREEFLVEYQEETPLEIKVIQLKAGMLQDTANKYLCKHTQASQTFLVTPTRGMEYIHGTATKMTVCIENAHKPLIIDSGAHFSMVSRNYLDHHFQNWEKKLSPTKAKNFKSESGKMTSIGKIIKEKIIPHWKGNIRINPEFVVLGDLYIQAFLLGTDYQRMEGQFSNTLTSKQKLSLLKRLRKNRPAFAIGEEPLGKIRGHDIESYLDVERPYQPMLRRPPYPASMGTRKEIEKQIKELLEIDVIRRIGHKEVVKITTSVLITWNDGKYRFCGDFRALNNYKKADRYPIPRIPHALEKLAKANYITKMDCMKGFIKNGVKPNSIKLLRIICHMGIYEYTRMPFGIKNAPSHFQRMMDTIFQEEALEGWMVVYIDDIIIYSETWEYHVQYIEIVLSRTHQSENFT
ncbi:hypothetical protein O181_027368 [Austropuccinia psidii MF-1]|uniref:Reverse transcriptase domain-containing protein n=1 Tax=Austropuccinia psidii MF-1 TaxID=1389203 RepID=A0A9Q3CPG2_9BASI|nr:hypothetical protein [Austropuccinia psidii MF-1]